MKNLTTFIALTLALLSTSALAQSESNPFTYSSWRDQQLACYGISIQWASNCFDIVDSDDRHMCFAMSGQLVNDPCGSIADGNLRLACYGMSTGNKYNCSGITNANMMRFCQGVAERNQRHCGVITDRDTQLLCYGMAVAPAYPSNCWDISDANARNFCFGVAGQTQLPCTSIVP